MKFLYDAGFTEIEEWVNGKGIPKFRAKQIYKWISRGVTSFDQMTDLSKDIRSQLSDDYHVDGVIIENKLVSAIDETIKYVMRLKDGNVIECVLMRYHHGNSICISSQAGCKMGCAFCASTGAGFGRNLSSGEMLAQVAIVAADMKSRISNIVVMGIGEPFDNYDQLILFLKSVNDPDGIGIGMRHICVSTCGLVDEMIKFTEEGLPVTFSISLHAPNDDIRKRMMPVANRYSMIQLLDACRNHVRATNRRITFEYSLFDKINDSPVHARELAKQLRGILCHVNLIQANEFEGGSYKKSDEETIRKFKEVLLENGINTTVRRELGTDIMAACGQLRRTIEKGV
ncbi:MAG: 23S rRNA (adenine(2503)-C(2))-methyltransferase RlmN [Saccharofermentanales bacterium]